MKAYTDVEQSKILKDILPIESADSHYVRKSTDFRGNPVDGKWSEPKYGNTNSKYAHYVVQNFSSYEKLSAWSLSALLDVLPYPQLSKDKLGSGKEGWMVSAYPDNCRYDSCWHNEPIDACVEMIIKMHELNLL